MSPGATFFCRLVPPRPSFARDMSPAEAKSMEDHVLYWREWMARGKAVVFGLVADPAGAYGVLILEVADEAEARRLTGDDPAIRAGHGLRYEVHPMPRGAVHRAAGAAEETP